jgi:two-component system, OmpR family, phosphate regulon sensor histidine kinase PhoR
VLALMQAMSPPALVGMALEEGWIGERLHAAASAHGVTDPPRLVPVGGSGTGLRLGPDLWRVSLGGSVAPLWGRRDVVVFGAGIGVVVSVLCLGLVLVARDVARGLALNRLRADLISGVTHELKSPLSVIRVYAETLQDVEGADRADRRRFADGIVHEAGRLARLVDDVVAFSRIEQGQQEYHLAPGDLSGVVQEAVRQFRPFADMQGVMLETDTPGVPSVRFDERAVIRAVLNLLDNAVKYSGDADRIELGIRATATHAIVEVRDRGIGIPREEQPRVFERFHRGGHGDRGGYGLGLYLVRHIMRAHEGTVQLWSEPGRGSCFSLWFPLAAAGSGYVQSADR